MAKLENDFRFTRREPVLVGNASSQDERVVVEAKIEGIPKHHFADLGFEHYTVVPEHDTELFRRSSHQLPILEKHFCRGEGVGFQNKLTLEIVNLIEWTAVTVFTLFEVRNPSWLRFFIGHGCTYSFLESEDQLP